MAEVTIASLLATYHFGRIRDDEVISIYSDLVTSTETENMLGTVVQAVKDEKRIMTLLGELRSAYGFTCDIVRELNIPITMPLKWS